MGNVKKTTNFFVKQKSPVQLLAQGFNMWKNISVISCIRKLPNRPILLRYGEAGCI